MYFINTSFIFQFVFLLTLSLVNDYFPLLHLWVRVIKPLQVLSLRLYPTPFVLLTAIDHSEVSADELTLMKLINHFFSPCEGPFSLPFCLCSNYFCYGGLAFPFSSWLNVLFLVQSQDHGLEALMSGCQITS